MQANRLANPIDSTSQLAIDKMVIKFTNLLKLRISIDISPNTTDDQLLGTVFKQTGWKTETNANLTLTYPVEGKKNDKTLTYVRLVVYQVTNIFLAMFLEIFKRLIEFFLQQSDKNHIHIVDGGVNNSTTISINIIAEQTKYLIYNATIYGK